MLLDNRAILLNWFIVDRGAQYPFSKYQKSPSAKLHNIWHNMANMSMIKDFKMIEYERE